MRIVVVMIFGIVALIQLSVPASMIWKRQATIKQGRVWKFRTAPVDPADAFRGRYIALGFTADEVLRAKAWQGNEKIYAVLKEDSDGFAQVESLSSTPIGGDNVIKVESGYWNDHVQNIVFPFNRYWITEKLAPDAERAYRENSRRGKENAYVTVRVRNGDAALEQLYIDNQPLADYLRAQAAKK